MQFRALGGAVLLRFSSKYSKESRFFNIFTQVGRYKNIRLWYPGYSLKLDTATGQLWAVHYDSEAEVNIEEVILKKQSHNGNQIGRYELRRTRQIGAYQVFDTSRGDYVTVKWTPKGKNG